jgi:hypothetical protein
MRILIHHAGTPTPIFETELEIIKTHQKLGDVVRVLQCDGALSNCHWNHTHAHSKCLSCRSRFANGLSLLVPDGGIELKTITPLVNCDYGFPERFESIDEIKKYKYDGADIGYGAASSLISKFQDHRFDTKKYHNDIIRELKTCVGVYVAMKKEILEKKPDLVYFFNGRIATHLPVKVLSEKMGLEYYSYEVSRQENCYSLNRNAAAHNVISKSEINALTASWSDAKRVLGESFFLNKKKGVDIGKLPSFTKSQVRGNLPVGFDAKKINIAIFNGSIDEYAGIKGWENPLYEPDETEGIEQILRSFVSKIEFVFHLRMHPNMSKLPRCTSQLRDIHALNLKYSNLNVIWPEQVVDSYALLDACAKVITFGSTMGVEATYLGKPSILVGKALYENFNCAYLPKSHDEVVALIEGDTPPLLKISAIQYGFFKLSNGIPFKFFKETSIKNGRTVGLFDGVHVKASLIWRQLDVVAVFVFRVIRVIKNPLLLLNLKRYF